MFVILSIIARDLEDSSVGKKLIYIIFIVLLIILLSCTKMETDENDKGADFYNQLILKKEQETRIPFDIIWNTDTDIRNKKTLVYTEKDDLNFDGIIDSIEYTIHFKPSVDDIELKINNSVLKTIAENPASKCYIVDINTNDQYKEIILHEDGPSADLMSTYYIYNGEEIIEIGTLGEYDYTPSGNTDIVEVHTADQFEPKIAFGYTMLDNDHMFVYREVDKSVYINKKYKVHVPAHPNYTTWPVYNSIEMPRDLVGEIKDCEEVTVIDVDTKIMGIAFKVQLGNSIEGWMVNLF